MEKTIDYELKRGEMVSLIRRMEIEDILRFPIAKHNSVRNTVTNNLLVERSEERQWSVSADIKGKQSEITTGAYPMRGHIPNLNTKEILLENIMAVMARFTFGKEQAAAIVGGESRLLTLIADGSIECEKTNNSRNGKWFCNAAQVLQHCRNARQVK